MDVESINVGKSYAREEVHFTGGLRGFPSGQGWALFPISEDADSDALVFETPRMHLAFATKECGLGFIGTCVRYTTGAMSPPMDVWKPGLREDSNGLNAADSWGAVAHQASQAGDKEYAECATYVSVCLKVAGLRLRDVSNKYHDQLRWALAEKQESGIWFSNAALLELYADFHSLVSELCSARDHLARLAAIHLAAPRWIDSLAKLDTWVNKPENQIHIAEPWVALLLSASGTNEKPNWLRRLGGIRNEMLHRVPMGANKSVSALVLQDIVTSYGVIKIIRLGEPQSEKALEEQQADPLNELSQMSANLEHLCRSARKVAKYPAELPQFTSRSNR